MNCDTLYHIMDSNTRGLDKIVQSCKNYDLHTFRSLTPD